MVARTLAFLLTGFALSSVAAPPDSSDRFYLAIRNNDLTSLRTLIKSAGVDTREKRGATPLMLASAYGSLDAMKLLIEAGADVNATNDFGATALLWSTYDIERVRLLLDKGAKVDAQSKQKRTPLLVASASNGASEVVKLLLDRGASLAVRDGAGISPLVAASDAGDAESVKWILAKDPKPHPMDLGRSLQNAAANGDVSMMKALITLGADVNAQSPPEVENKVKNGSIALGSFTPLILCAAYGGADSVKVLLDAGAKVDAQDVRGMTPLMLAIATDRADTGAIKALVAKGASLTLKDRDGANAIDWARKFNKPAVLAALGVTAAASTSDRLVAVNAKSVPLREAVHRSLSLMQKNADSFLVSGGCVSCHSHNIAALAVSTARTSGFRVNEALAKEQTNSARLSFLSQEQLLLQRIDPGGASDTLMFGLLNLLLEKHPADRTTDSMVHNVASEQRATGNWHRFGVARPPMEDGDFNFTALGIRLFQFYAPPGRKEEFKARIDRAAHWLSANQPLTTEDLNFRILGLTWAKHDLASRDANVRDLRAQQRPDGGWAQTPELGTDAYATGQALYALHEVGVPPTDEACRRGVVYLLQTQRPDGSWYVKSRSAKFQPYFQSGFPHDHDQWISSSGTAWATAALAYASTSTKTVAAR